MITHQTSQHITTESKKKKVYQHIEDKWETEL